MCSVSSRQTLLYAVRKGRRQSCAVAAPLRKKFFDTFCESLVIFHELVCLLYEVHLAHIAFLQKRIDFVKQVARYHRLKISARRLTLFLILCLVFTVCHSLRSIFLSRYHKPLRKFFSYIYYIIYYKFFKVKGQRELYALPVMATKRRSRHIYLRKFLIPSASNCSRYSGVSARSPLLNFCIAPCSPEYLSLMKLYSDERMDLLMATFSTVSFSSLVNTA